MQCPVPPTRRSDAHYSHSVALLIHNKLRHMPYCSQAGLLSAKHIGKPSYTHPMNEKAPITSSSAVRQLRRSLPPHRPLPAGLFLHAGVSQQASTQDYRFRTVLHDRQALEAVTASTKQALHRGRALVVQARQARNSTLDNNTYAVAQTAALARRHRVPQWPTRLLIESRLPSPAYCDR